MEMNIEKQEELEPQIPAICFETIGRLYLQALTYEDQIKRQASAITALQSQIQRLETVVNSGNFGLNTTSELEESPNG